MAQAISSSFLQAGSGAGASRTDRGRRAVYLLILITVNLALFLPSMTGDFLWDDKQFISENAQIQGSGFLRSFLFSPFGGFSGTDENSRRQDRVMQFYRPVVSLSYWLDFKTWGLNAPAFHLTNIVIQIANVCLFLWILGGLGLGSTTSFLGALLFSVYPLHFENVSWISGRTDLLAFFFAGWAALLMIRHLRTGSLSCLTGSALTFFLGLLCKENVIVLPLIFAFFVYKKEGKRREFPLFLGAFGGALLGWLLLRWQSLGPASVAPSGRTVVDMLATVGFYGWKLIFPFNLSLTVDSANVFPSAAFRALGAALFVGLGVSVWQAVRKSLAAGRPYWVLASGVLLVLPSVLVVLSPAAISLVAWRFLYLPSAVLTGALAWLLGSRLKSGTLAISVVAVLSILYATEIYPKNGLFGEDETGFWLGIENPGREDVIARYNIAVKTLPVDEKKAMVLFDGILGSTDHPLHGMLKTWIYGDLGVYFALRRDFPRAEAYFNELFQTGENQSPHVYFNYSYYLGLSGKVKQGEELVLKLLRQFPQNHNVLTRAAKFYLLVHEYGRAAELYAEDYRLFRNRQSQSLAQQAAEMAKKAR